MDVLAANRTPFPSEGITTENARKADLLAWKARRLEEPADPNIPLKFQSTCRYRANGLYAKVILLLKDAGYETEAWGNLTLNGDPHPTPSELNAVSKLQKMASSSELMLKDYNFTFSDSQTHIAHFLCDIADLNIGRSGSSSKQGVRLWHPNTLPPPEDFTIPYEDTPYSLVLGRFTSREQAQQASDSGKTSPAEYQAALTIRTAQLAHLCGMEHSSPGKLKEQLREAQAVLEGNTRQR